VTKKHYIKPPSIESTMAMRLLSETFSKLGEVKLLPNCSPTAPQQPTQNEEKPDPKWVQ